MTEIEQRIAIAEFCGWVHLRLFNNGAETKPVGFAPYDPFPHEKGEQITPDYLHDLNAMAEAEKKIDHDLYVAQLLAVIHKVGPDYFHKLSWEHGYELITATSAQRAEALLRTIGKWKDA